MAKRSKIKYEEILSYENLMKAHLLCKKENVVENNLGETRDKGIAIGKYTL